MIRARSLMAFGIASFLFTAPSSAAPPQRTLEISEENAALLENIENYPDLEVLSITCVEELKAIPDSIGKLIKLKELLINNGNGCSMNPVLPESIGKLQSLEKLVLYGAQDPRDPGPQSGKRHAFPGGMSLLKHLTYLDLGRNGLEEIPPFVKDLPNLRELHFAFNMNLKKIPPFLSGLPELTTLDLNSDGLEDLPDFLNTLPRLTHISMGNNCKITQDEKKKGDLRRRFPKVKFDFDDEYDCPEK